MSTELERRMNAPSAAEGQPTIRALIERMAPEIERAVPSHIKADRVLRLALTEIRRSPQLQRASAESLLGGLMLAAQLGFEPGGPLGQCYLVPRTVQGNLEVVFIVGYRGYVELAYRSGQVEDLHARVVWRGEDFRFVAGDHERIEHVPQIDLEPDPADFVAAYAVAHLRNGGIVREVIGPRHIARARQASAIRSDRGPWSTDFEAMARKTALRRLASLLPQSPELSYALALDETMAPPVNEHIPTLEEAEPRRIEPGEDVVEAAPAAEAEAGEKPKPKRRTRRRRTEATGEEPDAGRTDDRSGATDAPGSSPAAEAVGAAAPGEPPPSPPTERVAPGPAADQVRAYVGKYVALSHGAIIGSAAKVGVLLDDLAEADLGYDAIYLIEGTGDSPVATPVDPATHTAPATTRSDADATRTAWATFGADNRLAMARQFDRLGLLKAGERMSADALIEVAGYQTTVESMTALLEHLRSMTPSSQPAPEPAPEAAPAGSAEDFQAWLDSQQPPLPGGEA